MVMSHVASYMLMSHVKLKQKFVTLIIILSRVLKKNGHVAVSVLVSNLGVEGHPTEQLVMRSSVIGAALGRRIGRGIDGVRAGVGWSAEGKGWWVMGA